MKNYFNLIAVFAVIFIYPSCKNQTNSSNKKEELSFNFFDEFKKDEFQTFNFNIDSAITIKGERGTLIELEKGCLINANNQIINKNIELKLKECYDPVDIILNGLTTVSEDNLLSTSGMIHIEISANGKKLIIKDGKKIKVGFPANGEIQEEMKLFKADTTSEIITWNGEVSDEMEMPKQQGDSVLLEGIWMSDKKQINEVELGYYFYNTNKIGWLNSDKYMWDKEKTFIPISSEITYKAAATLFFKERNSYASTLNRKEGSKFINMPIGETATFIAFYREGEDYYIGSKELVIEKNLVLDVDFRRTIRSEFMNELKELTR